MSVFDVIAAPLHGVTLIEASAGTGKTHTITSLYLRLLVERELSVSQILVVTYTKAATAELRGRIRQRLQHLHRALQLGPGASGDDALVKELASRAAAGDAHATVRLRVAHALRSFDLAAIFTIHGYCQRVLAGNAFESRAAFDAELQTDSQLLRAQVAQDYFARSLYEADETLARAALADGFGPQELAGMAQTIAAYPDAEVLQGARPTETDGLRARFVDYARVELARRKVERGVLGFDDLLVQVRDALRGPYAGALAARMRAAHPAALIDEFQDTDPVQSEVFHRVYEPAAAPGTVLFLIGDPKQAIYGFRGADVHAYTRMRRGLAERWATLATNRRSDPRLLRALNALFSRVPEPFMEPGISYLPVAPPEGATDRLGGELARAPALDIAVLQRAAGEAQGKLTSKGDAAREVPRRIAQRIVALLGSDTTIDGRPVAPHDIAVLCRKNAEALAVQRALRALAVPAVVSGDQSVLDARVAGDLELLLRALLSPADGARLRAALGTILCGHGAAELAALDGDEAGGDTWLEALSRWHALWERQGLVPAIEAAFAELGVAPRLLAREDGERHLTDLLHLVELLHTEALRAGLGPAATLEWFARMRGAAQLRGDVAAEAMQIRLESDQRAVTITTIHKSKGLEYPIVYAPYLWDGRLLGRGEALLHYHDPARDFALVLSLAGKGDPEYAERKSLAEREARAEGLRLLYVALTRARHHVCVVWGCINEADRSPLAHLLGSPTRPGTRKSDDDARLVASLQQVAAAAPGDLGVSRLVHVGEARLQVERGDVPALCARIARRRDYESPRSSSFSGLAARSAAGERQVRDDAPDHDELGASEPVPPAAEGPRVVLADFPAGAAQGHLIHELYETLDFAAAEREVVLDAAARLLARYGMDPALSASLADGVLATLATPLGATGLATLSELGPGARRNELEFCLPVARTGAAAGFSPQALAALLLRHARSDAERDYASRVAGLSFVPLWGFLRGFMDLAAHHRGRFYLFDYKSNHLGAHADDYAQERMAAAMAEHHYHLQSLLYTVALDRHLRLRAPGYDYERAFGGSYYLFVRGMSAAHPPGTGVFAATPPAALVRELSQLLGEVP